MKRVASAWGAIRRRLARIRQLRQLVLNPCAVLRVWTLPRQPSWLESLHRVLTLADAAVLFPRLARGEGAPEAQTHLLILHNALRALSRPSSEISRVFADERWLHVRSTAPLSVWSNLLCSHSLVNLLDLYFGRVGQTGPGPIADLVALGHCPRVTRDCLRSCDLVFTDLHPI